MYRFLYNLKEKTRLGGIIHFIGYFYLALWNHLFNKVPIYWFRYVIVKYLYGLKIGKSTIHYGVTFLSPWGIRIGDNSNIQMGCLIDGRGDVIIGDNVDVGIGVKIFSEQHDIDSPDFTRVKKQVRIHNNSVIGSFALVLPGVTIHEGGVVGAGSVVVKDVPEYCLAAGNPAVRKRDRNKTVSYNVKYRRPFH